MSLLTTRRIALLAASALAACSSASYDPGSAQKATGTAPVFFIADQLTSTQRSTRAVVDAGTIWLLDADGDFVFGTQPDANWNADVGLALAWRQVPGASKYRVMARNTVTSPTDWKELLAVPAPDPELTPTVVAAGLNPWKADLGTGGFPWAFGNHVELAVTAEDSKGAILEGGLTLSLDTADEFAGVLTSVAVGPAGLPPPFDVAGEHGVTFSRSFRLSFSEPMRTDAPPRLTALSDNVVGQRVTAVAWGADPLVPSFTPASAAPNAFLAVELTVKGTCTELLVDRSPGDVLLEARDVALFRASSDARVLLLDPITGELIGEAEGVTTVAIAVSRIALATPLSFGAPAGSLLCALSGGAVAPPTWVDAVGERVQVSDATPFFVGEPVAVYEPQIAGTGAVLDVLTVAGVDTVANVLALSAPPSDGHGTRSVVLPLNGLGGEIALRPSAALSLQRDALGGPDVEIFLAAPGNVMVGDTVLVDGDGDLRTTRDQAQARVKQVKLAPDGAPSYSIVVVDLPPSLLLLHGRALVISLGDAFRVGGTRDTSAAAITDLDRHADQFSPDGLLY
ncbi:MAG TPA: hypothetical protein VF875_15210 [Anaeromyxobacter sp.]